VEDRVQLIVSDDGNEIYGGENEGKINTNEEENKTSGPFRGDIAGNDESGGVIPNTKPEDELVNLVGSRAVLTCNAGMCKYIYDSMIYTSHSYDTVLTRESILSVYRRICD